MKNVYKIFAECKDCNNKEGLKRYHDNKDKKSNQRKIYNGKHKDKTLQQQNDRFIQIKDLDRTYLEVENRLNAWEGKADDKNLLAKRLRKQLMFLQTKFIRNHQKL